MATTRQPPMARQNTRNRQEGWQATLSNEHASTQPEGPVLQVRLLGPALTLARLG